MDTASKTGLDTLKNAFKKLIIFLFKACSFKGLTKNSIKLQKE